MYLCLYCAIYNRIMEQKITERVASLRVLLAEKNFRHLLFLVQILI